MNLFFRLLWMTIVGRWRSRVSAFGPCRTPYRVWPSDLDLLRHVNNGVYFSLMDLARIDLMVRSGIAKSARARGWFGVVVAETIQFRKSLKVFERFHIETRALGWDEKTFVLEQRFVRGADVCAVALVRVRFLSQRGDRVLARDLIGLSGESTVSPELPEHARRWLDGLASFP